MIIVFIIVALNVVAARNCGTAIFSFPSVKDGLVYPTLKEMRKEASDLHNMNLNYQPSVIVLYIS